jgi:hypothetical protein
MRLQEVMCHKCDPSTLFLCGCGDHSGDDHHNVSSTVWSILMFRSNAPVSDHRGTVQEIPPSKRILVIGAGYAGLLFTMRLAGKVARQHVQIALVNESDTFTEHPRLHQFATNQVVQWRSLPQMLRRTNVQFIAAPRFERRWPGLFVWPGKRRYETAQRQQQAKAKKNSMQLHKV